MRPLWLLVAFVAVLSSACGGGEHSGALEAADSFAVAVSEDDGAAACALLAPATEADLVQSAGKPCDDAVLEEIAQLGDRVHAETYGTMSMVRYSNDVLFVTEFDDGWKVMAAGCTARPGEPYECRIKGR